MLPPFPPFQKKKVLKRQCPGMFTMQRPYTENFWGGNRSPPSATGKDTPVCTVPHPGEPETFTFLHCSAEK